MVFKFLEILKTEGTAVRFKAVCAGHVDQLEMSVSEAQGGVVGAKDLRCAPKAEPPGVLRVEVAIRDGSAEGGAG